MVDLLALAEKLERLPTMFTAEEARQLRDAAALQFTVEELRVIAVSCGRVKRDVFTSEDSYTTARSLATRIAKETGKHART